MSQNPAGFKMQSAGLQQNRIITLIQSGGGTEDL